MKLKKPTILPESECDPLFLQGMVNRRAMGYAKYGSTHNKREDYLRSIQPRIDKYLATGNTEWLIDVAVFAWLEFMRPSVEEAHFRATDSAESPGRYLVGERDRTQRHQKDA